MAGNPFFLLEMVDALLERGTLVDLQSLDASILRADETERCELVFRFDPIRDSKGRRFRFTLSSPDATGSQCVLALGRRDFGQVERHALVDRPGAPLTEYVPDELYSGDERVQYNITDTAPTCPQFVITVTATPAP